MDIFHTTLCIFSCFKSFRYRLVTCFKFSFVDQICMYQHAVHFIISERGENKLHITFTKNLFHKEPGLMGYDPMLLGNPLKHWGTSRPLTSDISHKTWDLSNTAVRILSNTTGRTSNLAILCILCVILCFMTQMHSICLLLGVSVSKSSENFFLLFCQRKL